jgi:hypothetical protein
MTAPQIEEYSFGQITIDGREYDKDLIVLPDRVISNWWRERGHTLGINDLGAVLLEKPEVLVVGQGAFRRMNVPADVVRKLEETGIEVIAQPTQEAIETYNTIKNKRKTAAALHLTC